MGNNQNMMNHHHPNFDKKPPMMAPHNESMHPPQQNPQMSSEILDMLTQILSKESAENHIQEPEKIETEHFWSGL